MGRKIGRKIALYVVVLTAVQLYTFHHYNSILTGSINIKSAGQTEAWTPQKVNTQKEINSLQKQYSTSAVSDDQTSIAYVDAQNVLHIRDLVNNKELSSVKLDYTVQYLQWIRNDMVFVGEQEAPGVLSLRTVDANTGTLRTIKTFSGLNSSDAFKKITYSALTNDTYILIGSNYSSIVYHFDTNGNMSEVYLGGRFIKNIAVTQTGNQLYFEDYASGSFNVLCRTQGVVQLIKLNSALVDVVGNTLYYGSIDSNGLVTAVYKWENGVSTLVSTLQTPTMASQIDVTSDGKVQVKASST